MALGFNGLTLKVVGRLRYIVGLNLAAALTNVVINLLLIPPLGALGAAIGTTTTLILHNVLKQTGLRLSTGISVFERSTVRVYIVIVAAVALLAVIAGLADLPLPVHVVLVAVTTLAVLLLNRDVCGWATRSVPAAVAPRPSIFGAGGVRRERGLGGRETRGHRT